MNPRLLLRMDHEFFKEFCFYDTDELGDYPPEYVAFWMFADELVNRTEKDIYVEHVQPYFGFQTGGGDLDIPTILVSFSSGALAAAATSFLQILRDYLSRNEKREITIERGDTKLILKGRDLPEETELIKIFFPESVSKTPSPDKSTPLGTWESRDHEKPEE